MHQPDAEDTATPSVAFEDMPTTQSDWFVDPATGLWFNLVINRKGYAAEVYRDGMLIGKRDLEDIAKPEDGS